MISFMNSIKYVKLIVPGLVGLDTPGLVNLESAAMGCNLAEAAHEKRRGQRFQRLSR